MRRLDHCPNCGAATPGAFCPDCGQRNADYRASLREILWDALDGVLQLDSRMGRTVLPLLLRPGLLTAEYNAGRRTRYSSPLRIYLLVSLVYFFALSLQAGPALDLFPSRPGAGPQVRPDVQVRLFGGRLEERLNEHLSAQIKALQGLGKKDAARRMTQGFLGQLPKALFALLPVAALLLKALYFRRYYIEHLVFALHAHAFVFVCLLLGVIVSYGPVQGALAPLAFYYVYRALRRVYGQGALLTALKLTVLTVVYGCVLIIALVLVGIVALLLL